VKRDDFIAKSVLNVKCEKCGLSKSVCRCSMKIGTPEQLAILMGLDPAFITHIEISPRGYAKMMDKINE